MEVTFAIGVVTVGLLGVIALLPLAADQARRGDITDRAAVLGLSGVEEFDMRGFRRPDMWLVWSPIPGANTFTPFRPGPGVDRWSVFNYGTGSYVAASSVDGSTAAGGYANPGTLQGGMYQAFCIDPRFLSANVPALRASPEARYFPYYAPGFGTAPGAFVPRMTRITVKASPALNQVISYAQAENIFVSDDDLDVRFPEDENELSYVFGFNEGEDGGWGVADVDDDGNGVVDDYAEAGAGDDEIVKRSAAGKYSWMATLAPKLDLGQSSRRIRDEYTLSIIVFYGRDASMIMDDKNERVANVSSFVSSGYGGGTVILEATDPDEDEHILEELREGDWVMLSALSLAGPVYKWYRISSADSKQARFPSAMPFNGGADVWQRRITLEGPDWNRAEFRTGFVPTQATLVSGVVAVYEKTVRLESTSLWNR